MIPQFQCEKNYSLNTDNFAEGIYDFSIGLAKKVLIADTLGQAVNAGYSAVETLSTAEAWLIMLGYTLQIYFDFSGYCDMASGIAKMFNFTLPVNFDSPYRSKSIPEFWQRWHATLGRFLRQYIYFPLGGNKKGKPRTYLNLMVVFLASGIWHGANWTFVLWGLFHGVLSCVHRLWNKAYDKIWAPIRCFITFFAVNIGWVLFRADSISQALTFYGRMFTPNGADISEEIHMAFYINGTQMLFGFIGLTDMGIIYLSETLISVMFFVFLVFAAKNINAQKNKTSFAKAVLAAACLVMSILSFSGVTEFLYFNF